MRGEGPGPAGLGRAASCGLRPLLRDMGQTDRALGDSGPVPDIKVVPPGPRSRALLERGRGVFYPGLAGGLAPFVIRRKRGYVIEDVDGNVFLDMISAMASVPIGACRPELVSPAVEALNRYGSEDSHYLSSEPMLTLAEKLLEISPRNLTRVDIALNGTEAVEIAVKFMRRATGRPLIIGFFGQYHGESTTTATLGGERSDISRGLRHLAPGFVHVPYPDPYRSPFAGQGTGAGDPSVGYIRDHLLFHTVHPDDVAGVVVEPIVGSGGVLVPPDGFWPALVELCREHDWLLCADEVKTGFGRTGKMFAVEHWGIEPDLMCLGKAIGGGVMPLGAVLGTERAMGSFDDVPTGSTWSWLPAACAAALEFLQVFEREGVLDNVLRLEEAARRTLGTFPERYEVVGDVRIKGALMAVEFVRNRRTKERALAFQEAVAHECLRRGLIADSSTRSYNVQPSLVTPVEVFERGIAILEESILAAMESGVLEG